MVCDLLSPWSCICRELAASEPGQRPLVRVRFRLDDGVATELAKHGWVTTRTPDGKPLLGAIATTTARAVAKTRKPSNAKSS
eukprot:SAG31_NODE_7469_length_1681_cov_2.082174_1_plen_82_part_00